MTEANERDVKAEINRSCGEQLLLEDVVICATHQLL